MEINNSSLFKYTLMKQSKPINTDLYNMNFVSTSDNDICYKEQIIENEISIDSIGSTITDEALENIYAKAQVPTVKSFAQNITFNTSTGYRGFLPEEIGRIKQLIYNVHNETVPPAIPNYNGESFINEFYDTETLFEYMHIINPEITKESGISKAQLIEFTQNDDWEDTHYDFFGSLNRIFDKLDVDNDRKLSYTELENFIETELGTDFVAYQAKVNEYSNQIQREYESKSSQEKLEFVIEKTREYLEASGLQFQLEALERLLRTEFTDIHNTIKKGNIAIADLNEDNDSGSITLGAYQYWSYQYQEDHNGITEDVSIYVQDKDDNDNDLGITLDISLLEGKWYELVNTLVHELTHATAYRYYEGFRTVPIGENSIAVDVNGVPIMYPDANNKSMIEDLFKLGALTIEEKTYYDLHWTSMSKSSRTDEETAMFQILLYKAACAWGEYSAYQADADYNDSIGQDVYYQAGDNIATAVDGLYEKDKIINHIDTLYNHRTDEDEIEHNESTPDYKWWSYV